MVSETTIYTIGHSTRPIDAFLTILKQYEIDELVDIRTIPYSGYNPQFNRESIAAACSKVRITYRHDEGLAGPPPSPAVMKKARTCAERSVGYDRYLDGETAQAAIDHLRIIAELGQKVALMCGEIQPDRCHRFRLAARLIGRVIDKSRSNHPPTEVLHIIDEDQVIPQTPILL